MAHTPILKDLAHWLLRDARRHTHKASGNAPPVWRGPASQAMVKTALVSAGLAVTAGTVANPALAGGPAPTAAAVLLTWLLIPPLIAATMALLRLRAVTRSTADTALQDDEAFLSECGAGASRRVARALRRALATAHGVATDAVRAHDTGRSLSRFMERPTAPELAALLAPALGREPSDLTPALARLPARTSVAQLAHRLSRPPTSTPTST